MWDSGSVSSPIFEGLFLFPFYYFPSTLSLSFFFLFFFPSFSSTTTTAIVQGIYTYLLPHYIAVLGLFGFFGLFFFSFFSPPSLRQQPQLLYKVSIPTYYLTTLASLDGQASLVWIIPGITYYY